MLMLYIWSCYPELACKRKRWTVSACGVVLLGCARDDSVTVAGFVVGKLRIISSACERNAGGRDIDVSIARHFAREFQVRWNVFAYFVVFRNACLCVVSCSPRGVMLSWWTGKVRFRCVGEQEGACEIDRCSVESEEGPESFRC